MKRIIEKKMIEEMVEMNEFEKGGKKILNGEKKKKNVKRKNGYLVE